MKYLIALIATVAVFSISGCATKKDACTDGSCCATKK